MGSMVAVVRPPVLLQLAQPAREVPMSRPDRSWAFEPKFDGWRALTGTPFFLEEGPLP
jgi:ATP-dependent DNA ligase